MVNCLIATNNIGVPLTKSYTKQTYKAGTQNWDIQQYSNDYLLFANNNGLLQFNGTDWSCFPLPKKTIVRAIGVDTSDNIYVGGQNEFGYFSPDSLGLLQYTSLLDFFPKEAKQFEDIWNIIEDGGNIYFNTQDQLFKWDGKQIKSLLKAATSIDFLSKTQQVVWLQKDGLLYQVQHDKTILISETFQQQIITGVLPIGNNKTLVTTLKNGLFSLENGVVQAFQNSDNNFLKEHRIYKATAINEDKIVLATSSAGVVIIDTQGRFITHLDKKSGLQNNNVLSCYVDHKGNIWLGLDNGVGFIEINTPFRRLIPDEYLEGTAYATAVFNEYIYFATANGIYRGEWATYYNPLHPAHFKLLDKTKGQTWGLKVIDNTLFIGHHEGAFFVDNTNQVQQIANTKGVWNFLPISDKQVVAGTYEGLILLEKTGNTWKFKHRIRGLSESCRIMERDANGVIWIAHPYRGIYKVTLSSKLDSLTVVTYGKKNGLPNDNGNHVFNINKQLVFTGLTGVYQYDSVLDTFLVYPELEEIIGKDQSVQRFFETPSGDVWYVSLEEVGLLSLEDKGIHKSFKKIIFPHLEEYVVRGFESIYCLNDKQAFIGADEGYIYADLRAQTYKQDSLYAYLSKVYLLIKPDSLLLHNQYNLDANESVNFSFAPSENSIHFQFASPVYSITQPVQFQYRLIGLDNNWSTWTSKTEKEYTNLLAGKYQFMLRASNAVQPSGQATTFAFSVRPPWYASKIAYWIYTLLGIGALMSLFWRQQYQFEKTKKQLELEQQAQHIAYELAAKESESAITQLKNQQLEASITHKNQELALTTMHLVQKSELINQLQTELNKIKVTAKEPIVKESIKKMMQILRSDATLSEDWEAFAVHFDRVHSDFLKRLYKKHPQLTNKDHRLCAYLRMNLSTKEIAPLLNISVRGVEIARYRLRKKLNLDSEINLNQFMLEI